ncbi:MAG: outer membrane beta-barrel protein [Ignavibacteriae bacterium]|nr:outer membrane beta-barrel protein [Ignavibacteria bacterium]MBI3364314.1 outer membrane beta-barrel protein [Ignavibacteriota bacterium]
MRQSNFTFQFLIIFFTVVLLSSVAAHAQENRRGQPQWWFGGAVAPNFNFYSGSLQQLNATVNSGSPFTKGSGTGLFLSPLLEYRPDPVWGGILTLGYDGRSGSFDDVSSQGASEKLSTSINYISLEPSLKISPFEYPLYFFAGPRLGFNVAKSFSYTPSNGTKVDGEWSGARGTVLTGQLGVGYDIPLSDPNASTQVNISPFLAVHVGQGPRSEESWSLTSLRLGVGVKFGTTAEAKRVAESEVRFSVKAPRIIPIERKVRETFPMRNYVFFDEGSTNLPSRYVTLTSEDAGKFKEEQLLEPQPKDVAGRSRRQLTVYHNIVNVVGDRMRRNPDATIRLIGSSDKGAAEGKQFAESLKRYLVDVFGIEGGRIATEGGEKPTIPSVVAGATRELDLLRPEDRRVEIASSNPDILDPVQIISLQEDPLDSDVLFTVPGASDILSSWSLEVTDESGKIKRYGPFTGEQERISGRTILSDQSQGRYTVVMLGETKSGQSIRKEENIRLVRSDEPESEPGLRFSILFEFDQSKTVATYERFLTKTVAPLIPNGGSVIIHGHTDIVGEESHNLKLSRDRANETMTVLQRELGRLGTRNVKFDTYGFGEDVRRAPFDNRLPEERFYNRCVVIDIVPE